MRAKTTPIAFVNADPRLSSLAFYRSPPADVKWSWLVGDFRGHFREDVVGGLLALIREWRQSLIEELDYVGFTVSEDATGLVTIAHALQRRRRESEMLADEATPGALKRSQYLLLADDFLEHSEPYLELKHLLEHYEQLAASAGVKPETIFQRFFERHPHLLQREAFSSFWAKPQLRLPESPGRFLVPDFVLKPKVGASVGTNWEVLDLKLPDDPLLTSGTFHPAFSAKLTRAIQQLRDYRAYFSRPETRDELIARFGYQPSHPRLAVLIGRRRRAEGLEHAQGSAALDIGIITYDDIVEFEQNRLVLLASVAGLFSK